MKVPFAFLTGFVLSLTASIGRICICGAALVMGPALASAATITVGTPTTFGSNAGPFGLPENSWGPQFQQLYASSAFFGGGTITSIGFDYSSGNTSMQPATYTLSLSTTTNSIATGIGPATYIMGSNTTVVYQGAGVSDVGGSFTFNLSNDFTYNPASGNLLLTVTATPVVPAAAALFLKGQQNSDPTMSEIYGTTTTNGQVVMAFNNGLVTNFGITPVRAALPLFATGLGGLGLLGWRRKRKAQAVA